MNDINERIMIERRFTTLETIAKKNEELLRDIVKKLESLAECVTVNKTKLWLFGLLGGAIGGAILTAIVSLIINLRG